MLPERVVKTSMVQLFIDSIDVSSKECDDLILYCALQKKKGGGVQHRLRTRANRYVTCCRPVVHQVLVSSWGVVGSKTRKSMSKGSFWSCGWSSTVNLDE